MTRRHATLACAVLVLLAGCGSSPKQQFYVLTPEASAAVTTATAFAPSILVGPVSVPEVVSRPQIVVHVSGNEVALSEYHRWAGPLESEIARVIGANLSRELGATRVAAYPQSALPNPDVQVIVDVRRFDSTPGDAVTIDALWIVKRDGGKVLKSGQSVTREPTSGAGFDALAAAHSRALAQMSRDIARAIQTP